MKKSKLQFVAGTSLACLLFLPPLAAQQLDSSSRSTRDSNDRAHADYGMRTKDSGSALKASELIGMKIENLAGEKIGSVDNLIIDLTAGRVVAVAVSSGGFLGLGDTLSVVPPTALRAMKDPACLQLDTTKEALRDAPRFKAGEWPDFAEPGYTDGVYRAYRQEPYSRAEKNKPMDADNTGRNARDRNRDTLKPTDQGSGERDMSFTQQIRKAVTATDGLSVTAKNVKIITVNGRVTLRGPVRTAQEKSTIAQIAGRVAGMENVDDQLEVATR